jgi:hypothetical protein
MVHTAASGEKPRQADVRRSVAAYGFESITRPGLLASLIALAACSGEGAAPDVPSNASACSIPLGALHSASDGDFKGEFVLAADGAMRLDGQPVGRVVCNEVYDASGAAIILVKADGSVLGGPTVPGGKFVGDELIVTSGPKTMRASVDDSGVLTIEIDGKTLRGRYQGGGQAKRAAIVAWLFHTHLATKQLARDTGPRAP